MAGLGLAMDAAVDAIRRCAGGLECISRRKVWRVETAITRKGELAIAVLVPREFESEWRDEPRPNAGTLIPLERCPPAVGALGSALMNVITNRGLRDGWLRVFQRLFKGRDLWVSEISIPAPDEHEQRRLRITDRRRRTMGKKFGMSHGNISEALEKRVAEVAKRHAVRFVVVP